MRGIEGWHSVLKNRDPEALKELLADNAVFHSPVVHSPQEGATKVMMYLGAAFKVLANPSFRYVRELNQGQDSVLEFVCEIDGIHVNGVDMIHFNKDGKIEDFKVMLRPLQGIDKVKEQMAKLLQAKS